MSLVVRGRMGEAGSAPFGEDLGGRVRGMIMARRVSGFRVASIVPLIDVSRGVNAISSLFSLRIHLSGVFPFVVAFFSVTTAKSEELRWKKHPPAAMPFSAFARKNSGTE